MMRLLAAWLGLVAATVEETPKVMKYDECVRAPKRLQETLYATQPGCNKTAVYCSTCLPTLLDVLDAQADCCEPLKGTPDPNMRKDAYELCTEAITTFKTKESERCGGLVPNNTDSKMAKFNACKKDAVEAETALYTVNADCLTDTATYCEKCFPTALETSKMLKYCCSYLDGDSAQEELCSQQGEIAKTHTLQACSPGDVPADSADAVETSTSCHTVDEGDKYSQNMDLRHCYRNAMWAKNTGIVQDPQYYTKYTFLNADSTLSDFQYVLYLERNEPGKDWRCPVPCNPSSAIEDFVSRVDANVEAIEAEMQQHKMFGAAKGKKGGMGALAWILIGLGVCCCMPLFGLCCSAFICYESVAWIFGGSKPEKKKKRALNLKKEEAPAMRPMPMPLISTGPAMISVPTNVVPMPVLQPVVSYHAPMIQHAPLLAQPVQQVVQASPRVQQPVYTLG